MKIKRIGIDIDDVITASTDAFFEYLGEYSDLLDLNDPRNNIIDIARGNLKTEEVRSFFNNNGLDMTKRAKLRANVVEVLKYFREKEIKIFIITARDNNTIPGVEEYTKSFLNENNVIYDKLFMAAFLNKEEICLKNKIDLMIDDSVGLINELRGKINTLLYTTNVNKNISIDATRVFNWLDIKEYIDEINGWKE